MNNIIEPFDNMFDIDCENEHNDISNDFDHISDEFDQISDDLLWDILEDFSSDKIDVEKKYSNIPNAFDKFNKKCSECNSSNVIFTSGRGSYVCGECGIESQEILDESPEWNNYEDGKGDNGRCGAPINAFFPKSSLGTVINTPGYSKIKMLKNWGQVPYKERNLAEVLNEIDAKCKKYRITKAIIDGAKILYKNMKEIKHDCGVNKGKPIIIRGLNCKQIIAACFHFGATLQKSPRSHKEVADIFNLTVKQVTKGCRKFYEIMGDNYIVFDIKSSHGSDFIKRFGSKIDLPKYIIELATIISNNAAKLYIASDHQATSLAAASILMAINIIESNNKLINFKSDFIISKSELTTFNKKTISSAFDISDVTISKTYKKLYPYKDIVISDVATSELSEIINSRIMIDKSNDNLSKNFEFKSVLNVNQLCHLNKSNNDLNNEFDNLDSETDIIIKKLNEFNDKSNYDQIHNYSETFICEDDEELDESDIIKKDNNLTKNNKIINQQLEKEKKKSRTTKK